MIVSPRRKSSCGKSLSIRITPGLYVMTTPETAVTTASAGSVVMRVRFGFHVSKTSTGASAVHLRYAHPSKGQAFQSKMGSFGAGCTLYDSLVVWGHARVE